jgi:hypothetical protein
MMRLPGINSVTSPMTPAVARNLPPYEVVFLSSQPRSFARQQVWDQLACTVDEEESGKSNAFYNRHWAQQYAARIDQLTNEVKAQYETINSLREAKEKLDS